MSFFGFKAILGHEGGTQKFRVVAQNKAIQVRFQMIKEKFPLTTTRNSTKIWVAKPNLYILRRFG